MLGTQDGKTFNCGPSCFPPPRGHPWYCIHGSAPHFPSIPPSLSQSFIDCCMPSPVLSTVRLCHLWQEGHLPSPQSLPHDLAWPGEQGWPSAVQQPSSPLSFGETGPPSRQPRFISRSLPCLEWPSLLWVAVEGTQGQGQASSTHHGSNQTHFCFCFCTTLSSLHVASFSFLSLPVLPSRPLSPSTCPGLSPPSCTFTFFSPLAPFFLLPSLLGPTAFSLGPSASVCLSVFHSVPISCVCPPQPHPRVSLSV